jgi:hypothetical protein
LGEVNPADTRLITFDLDRGEPRLPTLVFFQIPVKIQNITVHRCIIDEGESTCIMFKVVWKKLGSPKLVLSTITLRDYDGRPSCPKGIFQNVPVELGGKTILIDIEVIETPLDYNILFEHSYMYSMKVVASSVFRMMMFPHNRKIVTIDQLTHYEPNRSSNIDNILPLVCAILDDFLVIDISLGIFKDPSLLGTYHGSPPLLKSSISAQVCVVSSNRTYIRDNTPLTESPLGESLPQEFPENTTTPLVLDPPPPLQGKIPVLETVPQAITQITFFYPPPGVQEFQVATNLTLPNMVLTIPVWYLNPPYMVPTPSLPPQTEELLMQILVQASTTPPPPPTNDNIATTGGRRRKNEPIAPLPP